MVGFDTLMKIHADHAQTGNILRSLSKNND